MFFIPDMFGRTVPRGLIPNGSVVLILSSPTLSFNNAFDRLLCKFVFEYVNGFIGFLVRVRVSVSVRDR